MRRKPSLNSSTTTAGLLLACGLSLFALVAARAALPFTSATVTRVENKVSYGKVSAGRSQTRPAVPQDIVRNTDFLLSETDSRAELKYDDGTVVRVGQNTVFSFDANSRTLTLEKGTFIFFIPKGAGGCKIKTPSYTAAITGCEGAVTTTALYLKEGIADLDNGSRIVGGQYYKENSDGSSTTGSGSLSGGKLDQLGGEQMGGGADNRTANDGGGMLEQLQQNINNAANNNTETVQNSQSQVEKNNPPPAKEERTEVKPPPPPAKDDKPPSPYY